MYTNVSESNNMALVINLFTIFKSSYFV